MEYIEKIEILNVKSLKIKTCETIISNLEKLNISKISLYGMHTSYRNITDTPVIIEDLSFESKILEKVRPIYEELVEEYKTHVLLEKEELEKEVKIVLNLIE